MGTASFSQSSFLGGEWSKQMQGRFDREDYRTGLNVCLNVIPIEEGSAPRRSGTRVGGPTRSGAYGVLREYNVDQAQPYDIELTAGHLRLWQANAALITLPGTTVSGITSANPAVFTSTAHGLVDNDQVIFTLGSATDYAGVDQILGRQLIVTTSGDPNQFTAVDALTGAAIDGTKITFANLTNLLVFKIFDLATPYAEHELQDVRIVQDGIDALLLHHSHAPKKFTVTMTSTGLFSTATLTTATFHDGPYLDIPMDGTTLTPSATSGSITFTFSAITSINGGTGLQSTDVGRLFRIFSEPLAWASGTAYVTGNVVKEAGVYWKAVQNSTGVEPSTDNGTNWVIDTNAAAWTWGTITSVTSSTVFVGTLATAVSYPDNVASGNLLYTNAATAWQLGAYSDTSGYPSTGAYYQGRIWLGGAAKNRFDACVSNDFSVNGYINFAPTGKDGTVADNSGISGTLNAKEIENFLWMIPDEQGVLAGTQSGEWVIASSSAGEPITPTSILTRETTHYGSYNTPAVKVGRATIFVHRDTRKVYEYMANYFTQKFVAENLSLRSKHLTVGGVAEIAYMRELTPVIWCRLNNGGLIGCTYKHDDPIKPMEFDGWHRHQLGTGRNVISIQGGPANGGETDTLSMVTQDPTTQFCFVEFLQTIWDDSDSLLTAWYVDGGVTVAAAARLYTDAGGTVVSSWSSTTTYNIGNEVVGTDLNVYTALSSTTNVNPVTDGGVHWTNNGAAKVIVRLYGLWYMANEVVTVWGAGLDLGDYTVTAGGTIDLPLNSAIALFSDATLAQVTGFGCTSLSTDIIIPTADVPNALVYVMEAKENYDTTRVTTLAGLTTYTGYNICTDQNHQGIQWDAVRRNLMYMYVEVTPSTPTTNTTGFTLWDGKNSYAPGATIAPKQQFNTSVGVKNIDTDTVTFNLSYKSTNLVPTGIGGGDGTWRRATLDFHAFRADNGGNGPGMTDPYTGNFWINSQSCELYCFRLQDGYSQTISPLYPVKNTTNDVKIVGFVNTGATGPWAIAREVDVSAADPKPAYLYLIPKDYTATEITHDYLLAYATFTYPATLASPYGHNYPLYNREIFDHAGNMFVFSFSPTGGKAFKLYKFSLPTSAPYGGPTVGGGFTDVTPWGVSTGPNGDGSTYTLARVDVASPASYNNLNTSGVVPFYLPATDDLVLIEKFFPSEKAASSTDPALMFWSCTYVHAPAGTATFDHHSAFVTGYMTAAWAPTSIGSAAYAVKDAFEVNNYLGQSDYSYTGDIPKLDYTTRWFFFLCTKMVNGVSDNKPRLVLVQYKFVYGSAPSVVQVIDEQGWDDRYPDYGPFLSTAYEPYTGLTTAAVAASMETSFNADHFSALWDAGIHDPQTNTFWWSGGGTPRSFNTDSTLPTSYFGQFDHKFAGRMQTAAGAPGGSTIAATPPFLKLSFAHEYCAPFAVGKTYCSQGQILRPVTPNESMTQSGPSLGKFRRATTAGVLFNNAQGVKMGVDFLTMRSCAFMSAGGTIPLTLQQTFSGIYWAPVDAQSNYDNMWCWEVCRPYPCTVVAIELQHKANENT